MSNWPSSALITARAIHFAASLLAFNIWIFDRFIIVPTAVAHWRRMSRRLLAIALATAALSGTWWFAELAIGMSGHALQMNIVSLVWKQTHFGQLWQLRLIFFFAAVLSAPLSRVPIFRWIALIAAGLLLGSLAWAGHGRTEKWTAAHLLADAVHLLAAGCWPMGLLPFGLMLRHLRRSAETAPLSQLTVRFSAMSLLCVSLLTATGLINAWVLLGTVSNLWQTTYGRVLLVKVAVFSVMVGIGAVNLLHLKPRLTSGDRRAAAWLGINVTAEIALTILVITVVALLGLLPPTQ